MTRVGTHEKREMPGEGRAIKRNRDGLGEKNVKLFGIVDFDTTLPHVVGFWELVVEPAFTKLKSPVLAS